ncbi:hypothetical protein CL634_01935 [bacterium]|nr:hypothetical protein [bacterium]|tara:strand:- start:1024 stop:1389 length:366 start_codon:yes stop_codon:yes gene_type:complete
MVTQDVEIKKKKGRKPGAYIGGRRDDRSLGRVKLPVYTIGYCKNKYIKCYIYGELGNGLCINCWDCVDSQKRAKHRQTYYANRVKEVSNLNRANIRSTINQYQYEFVTNKIRSLGLELKST